MKQALVNGQLTLASDSAPATATCPGCSHPVDLRRRGETWFWRHQAGAPRDCPARSGSWQPAQDDPPSAEGLAELIAVARRIGVEVVTLEPGQTVEVSGPGVIILAARKAQ